MKKMFWIAWFAVCAAIGWAGSATATSCAFEAVGERAELELVEVTVDDEPSDGLSAYRQDEGTYALSTERENAWVLEYRPDAADNATYTQRFQEEGERP